MLPLRLDPATIKFVQYSAAGVPGGATTITGNSSDELDVAFLGGTTYVASYVRGGVLSFHLVTNGTVGPAINGAIANAVTGHVEALKNSDGTPTGAFVVVTDTGTSISAQKYTAAGVADGAAVSIVGGGKSMSTMT